MYRQTFSTLLPLLFLGTTTFSNHAVATNHPYLLVSEDENGLTLELTRPPVQLETIQTTEQPCYRIHIPAWGKTHEPGYPELPVKSVLMQVPQHGELNTQLLEIQYKTVKNVDLCPVPVPRVSENEAITFQYVRNETAYQTEAFFPDTLVKIGAPEILRGVAVSRLQIFPFQWNPVTTELRYADKIRVKLQVLPGEYLSLADVSENMPRTLINSEGEHTASASPEEKIKSAQENGLRAVSGLREVPSRHLKQSDALRIEITEAGIYRLSYEDLAEAGLQPELMNPERLRLFNQGEEVAIRVIYEDSSQFQPGDSLEFYAQGLNNSFTNTNVYWLYWRKKGFGKRVAQIDGTVTGQAEVINAFYEHVHFEQNKQFWLETPGAPGQDYWFWQRLNASDVKEYTVEVPAPVSEPTEAIVRLKFQGRSTASPHPNHHTLIKLNGTVIGDELWDGDSTYTQEMRVSSELLVAGKNTLTIEMPGDTGAVVDVIYLDWIELDYWRTFEAVTDRLRLNLEALPQEIQVAVTKLSQPDIVIYDITNPFDVAEVVNFAVEGEKRDYQASFETPAASEKTYYISTTQQINSPPSITPWNPVNLNGPKNGADYILITDKDFLAAVQPLAELRRRQGLRVKVVSVQDIYNEFNDGLFKPAAIKEFLQYAYHNWSRPAPTYVFLVGDANLNYKKTTKKGNRVPAHLSASYEGLTPDDNWYVSVDGNDSLPDMYIGRIPGNTQETVAQLIDKIIRFEESTVENSRKVLLVADSSSDFEDLNEGIFDYLPAGFTADKIYLRSYLADVDKEERDEKIAQASQDISASFNNGVMLSNYIGHGVMDRWSQAKGLFKPEDVQNLTNEEQLAFALMLTCINGYFVDSNKYSFAEEFLLAQGGAIGAFAPSNVSYTWEDMILANAVFSSIFEQGNRVLGAITTQAKIAAYEQGTSENVLQMFTLFGDPAVSLKAW
jgi:hypothetical protein